eukprot:TRINITY_DN3071_c0_g1_i1.p2 TRINITY_DN3071_c0_g1~~TRINITY_DN3071_c0_g1_i1.p2  ORF type:complete len:343 (-),score=87.39 TRINITY_DN3071_c0_g1_i1:1199-2110(-)
MVLGPLGIPTGKHRASGKTVALSAGTTYYELTGPEDGKPFVLVHGMTWWTVSLDTLVDHLVERGYRVLTFDLYGRGNSSFALGGRLYNNWLFVRQTLQITDHVFGEDSKIEIAGYSLGGGIAGTFTSKFHERVTRCTLIAPAGCGVEVPTMGKIVRLPYIGSAIMWAVGQKFILNKLKTERFADNFNRLDLVPTDFIDHLVKCVEMLFTKREQFVYAFQDTLASFDFDTEYLKWSVIPKSVPVIVLWGEADAVVQFTGASNLKKSIAHAKLLTIKDGGHGFALEFPSEFAALWDKGMKETTPK